MILYGYGYCCGASVRAARVAERVDVACWRAPLIAASIAAAPDWEKYTRLSGLPGASSASRRASLAVGSVAKSSVT